MSEENQDQLDRIESLLYIQRCEMAALLYEIVDLSAKARILMKTAVTEPKVPIGMVEVPDAYLRFRENWKKYLQLDLENLEKSQPARAARFQEIIDSSYDADVFGYDK